MAGKGDKRRPENAQRVRDNWPKPAPKCEKCGSVQCKNAGKK